jgi:ABC-type phosphate transport system substrate-binding protein
MKHSRLLSVLVWVAMLPSMAQAKQLAVVADTGNPTTNLSTAELSKIFNGHTRTWPDGSSIKVVMRDPASAEMQLVVRKVFNMSPDQVRALGQAHPGMLVIADSDDAILHFVSSNRGAVGVIDLYSLTKDVKVLKVDDKLPVEQGYLLRGN